jgi:hypothetical protein
MSSANTRELLAERAALIDEMAGLAGLMRGSVVERYTTCARPGCGCHQGRKHGPRHFLAVNEGGRQRQKYIRGNQLAAVRAGIGQYHRLQEIIEQLTRVNLELLRAE